MKANVLFWWSRGPPRGAAQPALPTYTTAHQGLDPIPSQSLRQLWRWRRVWMRRCLSEQLSKLHLGRKTRIQAGRREEGGRQTGRVSPEADRGEENGRILEAEAKRQFDAVIKPGGSGEVHGHPKNCVWLCWNVWVYLLSDRDCTASSSSLSNTLAVINAITWHI